VFQSTLLIAVARKETERGSVDQFCYFTALSFVQILEIKSRCWTGILMIARIPVEIVKKMTSAAMALYLRAALQIQVS
jgi:hypothetical protein